MNNLFALLVSFYGNKINIRFTLEFILNEFMGTHYRNHRHPRSKMKCNTLMCLLKRQAQEGIAHEGLYTTKLGGAHENRRATVSEVLHHAHS